MKKQSYVSASVLPFHQKLLNTQNFYYPLKLHRELDREIERLRERERYRDHVKPVIRD